MLMSFNSNENAICARKFLVKQIKGSMCTWGTHNRRKLFPWHAFAAETSDPQREEYNNHVSLLGWKDSNLRVAVPKTAALPLGDTPISSLFALMLSSYQAREFSASAFFWKCALFKKKGFRIDVGLHFYHRVET
jgi:hypothetical protein